MKGLEIGDQASLRDLLRPATVTGESTPSPKTSVSSVSSYATDASTTDASGSRARGGSSKANNTSGSKKYLLRTGSFKKGEKNDLEDLQPDLDTVRVVTWGALDETLAKANVQGAKSSTRLAAANAFSNAIGRSGSIDSLFGREGSSTGSMSSHDYMDDVQRYTPDARDLKTLWVVNQELEGMLAGPPEADEGEVGVASLPSGYLGCFDVSDCKATIARSSEWSSDTFDVPRIDHGRASTRQFATLYSHDDIMWRRPVLPHGGDYETNHWRKSIGATHVCNTVGDILDCLGRCHIFQRMDLKQRLRLIPHLDYLLFEPGQSAIAQGTREGIFMFVIFDGAVEAHKHRKGRKIHLRVGDGCCMPLPGGLDSLD